MKCVLFDLDGTVADTEVLKAKALSLAVKSLGGDAAPEIYKSVMGQSWEDVTSTFFRHAGVEVSLESFNPIFREKYSALIDSELIEKRAILKFICFLKSKGLLIGLVSSASPWMIDKALSKLNLKTEFDIIVSNADTDRHKPYPDAYLIALEKLGVASENTIVFEDSQSGFQAASAAGLTVYGIRHNYNELHDFQLCRGVLTSFEECLGWEL